jgi:hypothetical protein
MLTSMVATDILPVIQQLLFAHFQKPLWQLGVMSRDRSQVHLQLQCAATYPRTCFSPVTYIRTAITMWAAQCLPCVNTHNTIETTKQVINLLNRLSHSQVSAALPSWNNHLQKMRGRPYMLHCHIYFNYNITPYFTWGLLLQYFCTSNCILSNGKVFTIDHILDTVFCFSKFCYSKYMNILFLWHILHHFNVPLQD